MKRLSIRTALTAAMLGIVLVCAVLFTTLGIWTIQTHVRHNAQRQIDNDLATIGAQFDRAAGELADAFALETQNISGDESDLPVRLARIRDHLHLHVLNACDAEGRPIAGAYPPNVPNVQIADDPILRRALTSKIAHGTVLLDTARLRIEGGLALENALAIAGDGTPDAPGVSQTLFWWFARPLHDSTGRIVGVLYGGRALNRNFDLVDRLRDLVLGTDLYKGKPLGTVTIFLGDTRVATNVRDSRGRRAIGTVVSPEVRHQVLKRGESWHSRAWVVDAWYLSAYRPLRDPDDAIVGMLYVGLLEAPYRDFSIRLIVQMLAVMAAVAIVALVIASFLFRRITAPLAQLEEAAGHVALGERERRVEIPPSYEEIDSLAEDFRRMQDAISMRDRDLEARNRDLADANTRLEQANHNYMETLAFVTHEIKSPLAAMQNTIDLLVQGYMGQVPDKARDPLTRIRRNCEELQDMVKNYLDLARAERDELSPAIEPIDFHETVIDPCVTNSLGLFQSRGLTLEVHAPETLSVPGDQELLRIALANYLSNAAKYGREGGKARLEVERSNNTLHVAVWNEGEGFSPEEGEKLFAKFSRLKNKNTRGKRGSGLGLFLCKRIIEAHGGQVRAESVPGEWARFSFDIPASA